MGKKAHNLTALVILLLSVTIPMETFAFQLPILRVGTADLEVLEADGETLVTAWYKNVEAKSVLYRYTLSLSHRDADGTQRQATEEGDLVIRAGRTEAVTIVELPQPTPEAYRINFKVYKGKMLTGEATLVHDQLLQPDAAKLVERERNLTDQLKARQQLPAPDFAKEDESTPPTPPPALTSNDSVIIATNITRAKPDKIPLTLPLTPPPPPSADTTTERIVLPLNAPPATTPPTAARHAPAPDLEISGLVIDETRTKVGRDFYELFFNRWNPPLEANAHLITFKELPARGRMAQVAILVDGNQIALRFLQPRADIIEIEAQRVAEALVGYFRNLSQYKKDLESEDQSGTGI